MDLAHFRLLIHELLRKDPNIFPEEAPAIVLYSKYAMCVATNGNYIKHKRHIASRIFFKGMVKSERCTKLTGVRKVYNWQTLLTRILVSMIYINNVIYYGKT